MAKLTLKNKLGKAQAKIEDIEADIKALIEEVPRAAQASVRMVEMQLHSASDQIDASLAIIEKETRKK